MLSFLGGVFMSMIIAVTSVMGGLFSAQEPLVDNLPQWLDLAELRGHYALASTVFTVGSQETSLLVWYDGEIVYEEYRHGTNADTMHPVNSINKSILGVMVGMLLHDGTFDGMHQLIYPFFPEARLCVNSSKRDMTLHHLLTMQAGLPWLLQRGSLDFINCEQDSGLAAFLTPQRAAPGAGFRYDGGAAMQILVAVIERATGQCYYILLQEMLLQPLGMYNTEQRLFTADGRPKGGAGLYMTIHDMLRFGVFMLQGGLIDGVQVLPDEMLEGVLVNMQNYPVLGGLIRYNMLWWGGGNTRSAGRSVRATGFAGQLITIYPDTGVVTARTGRGPFGVGSDLWPLVRRNGGFLYLIP
ncbi:MAG: beta-lactamase family protein [Oscillospiraceae bacterium]|nr:beta-lactamase family protein [Oscillospiraceae bacterium]